MKSFPKTIDGYLHSCINMPNVGKLVPRPAARQPIQEEIIQWPPNESGFQKYFSYVSTKENNETESENEQRKEERKNTFKYKAFFYCRFYNAYLHN